MAVIKVILKKDSGKWVLETEKGVRLSFCNKKSQEDALDWAKKFILPWYNWEVVLEQNYKKDTENEKESRMPGKVVCAPKMQD